MVEQGHVYEWGLELLERTVVKKELTPIKLYLQSYRLKVDLHDDIYIWLTTILALKAAEMGNFGVGSVLIDRQGNLVGYGHNKVFNPYFRSDLHAEMVVMSQFEDENRNITHLEEHKLYTSLESCPMCLARLITSRVGSVLHAAQDVNGGMVHKIVDLPPGWVNLSKRQSFNQADCSHELVNMASKIISYSVAELDKILENR